MVKRVGNTGETQPRWSYAIMQLYIFFRSPLDRRRWLLELSLVMTSFCRQVVLPSLPHCHLFTAIINCLERSQNSMTTYSDAIF